MSKWQPIETAPKGCGKLLVCGRWRIAAGELQPADPADLFDMHVAWRDSNTSTGWAIDAIDPGPNTGVHGEISTGFDPEYWVPLPEPPND